MKLYEEILTNFLGMQDGDFRQIKALPQEYPGIIYKNKKEGVMVGIEIGNSIDDLWTKFTSCNFFTESLGSKKYLLLSCKNEFLYNQFTSLCCEFLEPGHNGIYRNELTSNPLKWWEKWKSLLGNTISENNVYYTIAEMYVLEHLFKSDKSVIWHSADAGIRDIESDTEPAEVKSTICRTGYIITASSMSQFDTTKPFWLYFCRMASNEKAEFSIKSMYQRLINVGYDKQLLDEELLKQGINLSEPVCSLTYEIIEKVRFRVDDSFPRITDSSFKNDVRPKGIGNISFEIDLDCVNIKETW